MTSYTRQSSFSDGDTITAALFNNEYNQILGAFAYASSGTTGHRHDGTAGEGGNVHTIGDQNFLNKIVVDSTNNRWGIFVEVSSSAVEQIRVQDGAIVPVTDNDIDLGTSSLEFKDGYFDGTVYADAINFNGTAITATAAELNILDGVTASATDINLIDGITNGTVIASKVIITDANKDISGGRNITISGELDAATLDISGDADIDGTTNLDAVDIDGTVQIDGVTTFGVDDTGVDVKFFGATSGAYLLWDESADKLLTAGATTIDIVKDKLLIGSTAVTTTAAELNILDGVTSTTAELNILDGVTSTAAELNILDGVTSTAAELNILDGVTSTAAELNILDGVTATASEINLIDGDTSRGTTAVASGDGILINDAGTMRMTNVDTVSTYFSSHNVGGGNIVTTGALNSGSITSGFGAIDNGSSAITTTGTVTFGSLSDGTITATAFVDEDDMSSDSATLIPTQQSVKAYVDGQDFAATSFVMEDGDGTEVTITKNKEMKFVEGGGIDINWTDTDNGTDGDPYDLTFTINAAQTDITSLLATDIKIGEDDQTKIDFETADEIHFYAANAHQIKLVDGALVPVTDNDIDLGTSSLEFKDAYFDGTVTSDAFAGPLTGNVTGNVSGTAATVTGAAQSSITSLGTLTTLTVDNVVINGATIGHGDDTDLMTVADGVLTVAGEVSMTTLDIGGTNVTSTAAEINLIDGGTSRGTTAVASGDGILINDAGTMRMTNVDTVSTYFASHSVGGGNIVTTGALNSGSITSGFGSIDNGSSAITTTGVITGGTVEATTDTAAGDNAAIGYTSAEGLILTGQGSSSDITFKNDADTTVFSIPTGAADVLFPDGARVLFGAGSDLQIFHDGSNSYITDAGTGALIFKSNTYSFRNAADNEQVMLASEDGAVTLYHNNVAKLATSASGVTATGTLNATTSLDSPLASIRNPSAGQLYLRNSSSINRIDSYDDPISATYPLQLNASQITFFIADAEKMRITSAGKVGIGTTNPGAMLQAHSAALGTTAGNSQDILQLHSPDTSNNTVYKFLNYRHSNGSSHDQSELRWQRRVDVSNHGYIGLRNEAITFGYGDNTERMRMLNDGQLIVAGTSFNANGSVTIGPIGTSSNGCTAVSASASATNIWRFYNTNGQVGGISISGSATTFASSSDYRLKENVDYSWDATSQLKQLKPAKFNFIADPNNTVDGFIAHEVQEVVPHAVTGVKDGKEMQGIDHSKLVPLLTASLQEALKRIDSLEEQVNALKGK